MSGLAAFPAEAAGDSERWFARRCRKTAAFNDLTTIATVVSNRRSRATLVARETGVVCGLPLALEAFRLLDAKATVRIEHEDGARVEGRRAGAVRDRTRARAVVGGACRAELHAAAVGHRDADVRDTSMRCAAPNAKILDTRKTTPGWRALEKYAVRAGGGTNHRMDLSTGVLIKDNHLAALDGDVAKAVRARATSRRPGVKIEVECDRVEQVERARRTPAPTSFSSTTCRPR